MPVTAISFAGKPIVLRVDSLIIRYDPDQPVDAGLAQRVAELTGGQTLDDLYQAHQAQEAVKAKPQTSRRSGWWWLSAILQHLKAH